MVPRAEMQFVFLCLEHLSEHCSCLQDAPLVSFFCWFPFQYLVSGPRFILMHGFYHYRQVYVAVRTLNQSQISFLPLLPIC